jgi:hypothetical protein
MTACRCVCRNHKFESQYESMQMCLSSTHGPVVIVFHPVLKSVHYSLVTWWYHVRVNQSNKIAAWWLHADDSFEYTRWQHADVSFELTNSSHNPCGKQHLREIATPDLVRPLRRSAHTHAYVRFVNWPTQSGVAISRKCCFPHGSQYDSMPCYGWTHNTITACRCVCRINTMLPKRRFWKVERTLQNAFRRTFQWCEYSIWATKLWKVLPWETHSDRFVRPSKIFFWGA